MKYVLKIPETIISVEPLINEVLQVAEAYYDENEPAHDLTTPYG